MAEITTQREYQYIEELIGPRLCKLFSKVDACCAGGAITSIFSNQPINDFDIFFKDDVSYDKALNYFKLLISNNDTETKQICETSRANTFKLNSYRADILKIKEEAYGPSFVLKWKNEQVTVQLINPKFIKGTPEEVFETFDFTICMGAYVFKENKFTFHPSFLRDLSRRELVFNKDCSNVVSSLFRSKKYQEKGFTLSEGELLKIVLSMSTIKFDTFSAFDKQIQSVLSNQIAQHIHNTICFTNDSKERDKTLLDEPYNANTIIETIDDYRLNGIFAPKVSYDVQSDKSKITEFNFDKWVQKQERSNKLDAFLDSDLSDDAINDIFSRKEIPTKPESLLD